MVARDIEGVFRPGVTGPDDEDGSVRQLGRPSILARMKLHDRPIELVREVGHEGLVVGASGHHDGSRRDPTPAGGDREVGVIATFSRYVFHARPRADGQPEACNVGGQVVGQLVLGRA